MSEVWWLCQFIVRSILTVIVIGYSVGACSLVGCPDSDRTVDQQ
jgi:hypothetical protein